MKKKGLIIATIVMVLVLAVSLTTATYAWFTAAAVTKVDAFTFSVANNNDVNIGVKANNVYASNMTTADFVSGTVTYVQGTAGTTEGMNARSGAWTGTVNGLSSTVDHDLNWGAQSKAVGFSTANAAGSVTKDNIHAMDTTTVANNAYVYSASGVAQTSISDVAAAVCNGNTSVPVKSDYVYLPLGVQPNKALYKNELIIYVDAYDSAASIVGMLAALHVAYRINGGAITDVQPFGAGAVATANQSATYATSLSTMSANLSDEVPSGAPQGTVVTQQSIFGSTFSGVTYRETKSGSIVIDLTSVASATSDIAEVDMWFYLAGNDTDCQQGAVVNVVGNMYIFFYTIPTVVATSNP